MDENELFRRVTLCICGNPEIEEALHSCIKPLKKVMPLDRMCLQCYK